MALLRIFDVVDGARDFILGDEPLIMGRERGKVDIYLHDMAVSRKHAKIYLVDDVYFVEDLDSSCGTLLNNLPIHVSRLNNRDNLQLGSTVIEYLESDSTHADDEQTTDTVDGLMSNYRTLPSQMKLSYRVIRVLADSTFSTGDTVVIGRGGLLIDADINPVDMRNVLELKIEWPDGKSKLLLGEVVASVKREGIVCIKLHHIPELKLNSMFDKVERSCWSKVVIS